MTILFPSLYQPSIEVLKPIKRLAPSEIELMVIAGHLLWQVEGVPGITEQTEKRGTECKTKMFTELHGHYTAIDRNKNYAMRVTQLMNIVAHIQKIAAKEKEEQVMERLFNLSQLQDDTVDSHMN